MEVIYSENPGVWAAMAIPEEIQDFGYTTPDGPFVCVTLRPKIGEAAVFSRVPTAVFLVFKAKWEALAGRLNETKAS